MIKKMTKEGYFYLFLRVERCFLTIKQVTLQEKNANETEIHKSHIQIGLRGT